MANMEHALIGLQQIMEQDLPAALLEVQSEWNDGIRLESLKSYDWEEFNRGGVKATPAALMLGIDESDPVQRDQIRDATILLYLILTDRQKTFLTKKLFRYADAMRRVLRPARNRTLRGVLISAKITRAKYSPTWVDRDNMYTRDVELTIAVRVPRGDA